MFPATLCPHTICWGTSRQALTLWIQKPNYAYLSSATILGRDSGNRFQNLTQLLGRLKTLTNRFLFKYDCIAIAVRGTMEMNAL